MVDLEEICALAVAVDGTEWAKDAVFEGGGRGDNSEGVYDGQSALWTAWVTYFRFLKRLRRDERQDRSA